MLTKKQRTFWKHFYLFFLLSEAVSSVCLNTNIIVASDVSILFGCLFFHSFKRDNKIG